MRLPLSKNQLHRVTVHNNLNYLKRYIVVVDSIVDNNESFIVGSSFE